MSRIHQDDPLGDLGKLPPELWVNVTKYLDKRSLTKLQLTGKSVADELEGIKGRMPDDKWKAKLQKLNKSWDELKACNVTIAALHHEMRREGKVRPDDMLLINDYFKAFELVNQKIEERILGLTRRDWLSSSQKKELKEFQDKLTVTRKNFDNAKGMISKTLAELIKRK